MTTQPTPPQLVAGTAIDLQAAGLALVCVPHGAGEEQFQRMTDGRPWDGPAFFRDGTTYYVTFANPDRPPPEAVGAIRFRTHGMIELPEPGLWLSSHEERLPVPVL